MLSIEIFLLLRVNIMYGLRRLAIFRTLRCPNRLVRQLATQPTRVSLKISELPKVNPPPKPEIEDAEPQSDSEMTVVGGREYRLTPLMKTVRELMDKHKDYVVLTQVGSFYEFYFEQATEYSEKLNIKLAQRAIKDFSIPMAGFPVTQLERYLRILVQDLHQGVAIVNQYPKESEIDNDAGSFPRRVSRLVTPGTLIDEAFLNEQENNFLLAIKFPSKTFQRPPDPTSKIGLAWVDISVGSVFTQEVKLEDLTSTVARVKPSEIFVAEEGFAEVVESRLWYGEFIEFQKYFINHVKLPSQHKPIEKFFYMFTYPVNELQRTFGELTTWETAALRTLLHYVEEHLPETQINLQLPKKQYPDDLVFIDSRTSEALELHVSLRNRWLKGSLFSAIKRTVSPGGSRLLSIWLSAPSRDIKELKQRQAIVSEFVKSTQLRTSVIQRLKKMHDVSRILQRFALGKGSHFEMVQLAHSIQETDSLEQLITEHADTNATSKRILKPLLQKFNSQSKLAEEILEDLDEDAIIRGIKMDEEAREEEVDLRALERRVPVSSESNEENRAIFIVKPSASKKLAKLHRKLESLYTTRSALKERINTTLKTEGGFRDVALKVTMSGDYQIYVKGGKKAKFDQLEEMVPGSRLVSQSKSTAWLDVPEWKTVGQSIDSTISKINGEEQSVLKLLRLKVLESSVPLRESAGNTEYIDVITSFAELAVEKDLVCPELEESTTLEIVRGRHLVAEEGLKRDLRNFVPNDCHLTETQKKWVITGPNMGGKSTFLRQNAIIVILAQIGCFVPAQSAKVGIVDKIFSRVGFNDDMINRMSTFMVEMAEVTAILRGSTERSLAILDEVGRGTSGREGVAIAFSALWHLDQVNNCRVLFATHFGKEVATLLKKEGLEESFAYKKTALAEVSENLVVSHKLVDGITDRSYAINVAKEADYPTLALEKAKKAYDYLTEKSIL